MPRLLPIIVLLLVALQLVGCGEDPAPPRQVARWECPATWVAYERGGCGPAVLLCVPGGGAAPGACEGVDLSRPLMIALPDGGTVRGFYRLPDGGIGGGWPEPGDPDGSPVVGITECAEGWQRLPDGTCDPMLRTDCPEGSGALPGGRCTPTALSDCPAVEYEELGAEARGAAVVHVRAGADATAADGTTTHPFATITAGVARVGLQGWVLVARGEYREQLYVGVGTSIHVLGACAARVTLRGAGPPTPAGATVTVEGARAVLDLRGVTVTGTGPGARSFRRGTLRAAGIVLSDNTGVAVAAVGEGAVVEVTASVVRRTRGFPGGTASAGLTALGGAVLRASDVVVVDNADLGVHVQDSGTLGELSSSVVRATRPREEGRLGRGLMAVQGATLRATGVLVVDNSDWSVGALGAGTVLELVKSVVRGTRARSDGTLGRGLIAEQGATVRATDLLVADSAELGVSASNANTRVELVSSVVRGGLPRSDGTLGRGLQAQGGATLRATGVLVADHAFVGVGADGPGTVVELDRSVVRNTRPRRDAMGGNGLLAGGGATLRATGVLVANSTEVGVDAFGSDTVMELAASVVRNTQVNGAGTFGRALGVQGGATLRATGVLLADNSESAVFAAEVGTEARLSDTIILGVRPNGRGLGMGLLAMQGARLEGVRVAVQAVHGTGVAALPYRGEAVPTVALRDLLVRDVRSSTVRTSADGPTVRPVGRMVAYGLHVGPGCSLDATHAVLDHGGFGFFSANGTITLRQGIVSRQIEGLGAVDLATPDGATTLEGVSFLDNATDRIARRDDLPTASELPPPTRSE
ncbi:MAG: hypothetical protein HY909_30320 [Deltaproteobacteria bacterium]|nr:hypothetical protein [Deltaproteobacteria bacterium]